MENVVLIFRQIFIMFFYMGIGFFFYRKKLITKEGSACMANLLLYVILPCVIFRSFSIVTNETAASLFISFFWGAAALILSMLIAALLFRQNPIAQFGAAFSNAGFMGIPLITAVLGSDLVFHVAGLIALLNIFQWFYGQSILSGTRSRPSLSVIMKNPLILSLLAGITIFILKVPVPKLVSDCLTSLAGMNAPVAMLVLGVYMAQTTPKSLFCKKSTYWVSCVRLLIISTATVLLLWKAPGLSLEVKMALLIAASAPIGSNVAVYAQKLQKNYVYAVETVCLSTLFSVLTMPAILALAGILWR